MSERTASLIQEVLADLKNIVHCSAGIREVVKYCTPFTQTDFLQKIIFWVQNPIFSLIPYIFSLFWSILSPICPIVNQISCKNTISSPCRWICCGLSVKEGRPHFCKNNWANKIPRGGGGYGKPPQGIIVFDPFPISMCKYLHILRSLWWEQLKYP